MNLFKKEPTLEELEAKNESLQKEAENWKYKAEIARLKRQIDGQGGKGLFSKIVGDSKGKSALSKAWNWVRGH